MQAHKEASSRNERQRTGDTAARVKRAHQCKYLKQSQQTDSQRREVRRQERELLTTLKASARDLANLTTDTFEEIAQQLNDVYEAVRYPHEASLDALNLDELSLAVARQSQALNTSNLTKASDLISAARRICVSESQFDWAKLGDTAGACFRSVPDTSVLFGPMDAPEALKERKKASVRAKQDDDAHEDKPSEYASQTDRKDSQARRLKKMQSAVEENGTMQLFDFVLDPRSFAQTVENLFDMSFLVRNEDIEVGVGDEGLPYLHNHEGTDERPTPSQSIIGITPAQWEELSTAWGSDEPLVGHRS